MADEEQTAGPKPVVYTSLRRKTAPKDSKPEVISAVTVEKKADKPKKKKEVSVKIEAVKKDEEWTSDVVQEVETAIKKPKKKKKSKQLLASEENVGENVGTETDKKANDIDVAVAATEEAVKQPRKHVERKPVARPIKTKNEVDATRIEIEQLRIRFPDLVQSPYEGGSRLVMTVPILDPEFPYALESVKLQMDLPAGYPKDHPLSCAILNTDIPAGLQTKFKSHMDAAAKSLLGQQALRPMIRFMEKNLEMMLTPTANPAGFKFVSHTSSPTSDKPSASPPAPRVIEPPAGVVEEYRKVDDDLTMPEEYYEALRQLNISDSMLTSSGSISEEAIDEYVPSTIQAYTEESLPTKSRFKPGILMRIEPISRTAMAGTIQMQFANTRLKGIGLLLISQLGVLMRCDRCKASTPIEDVRPDADRLYSCRKCSTKSSVSLRIDAVHDHNQCAGYLRCRGGLPADWLPSTVQITCGQCTPDDPTLGSVRIEGVQVGELINCRCRACHRDMSLEIGRVDWIVVPGLHQDAARPKRGAVPKLPSQVGEPLPDRGACKHYRKSLRWFRFPCCGKAYPCDTCHDEDPANAGHRAEWASRHICGMCSRELPISQKECACGAEPASTRRSTHWEGGKGMRDQTLMSRKDNKKYRNLTKPVKPATTK